MSDTKPKVQKVNSLSGLVEGMANTPTINQTTTAQLNNRYNFIFNNRQLLNELYIEHGLIQTLIDMPVDDALRGGFEIHSDQLDEQNIKELQTALESTGSMRAIGQTAKWGRLFGGGGLIPITGQKLDAPFTIDKIREGSHLEFYSADLWELNQMHYETNPTVEVLDSDTPYMFYGKKLHKSRVIEFKGKEAPSLRRPQFRGWGMTEVERMIRSFNQYLKNNNVIFELLDEAKVDVFKMMDFNLALQTPEGTSSVQNRIQSANMIKNYVNAVTMDVNDEYEQKTMNFAGLGEMLTQIRMGVASDLKMPMTKLFGISSAGFNSGEDDIENYNSMIEHEVRAKIKPMCSQVVQMLCANKFGMVPDDIEIKFPPLRILSAEQEENVKNSQFQRVMDAFNGGVIDAETAKLAINEGDLLGVDVEVNDDVYSMADEAEVKTETVSTNKPSKKTIKAPEVGDV